MYKTNSGIKVDDLLGEGSLEKIMKSENLRQVLLDIKEMGKREVGKWRPSEIFKSTQEVFDALNEILGLEIKVQHKRGQRNAIDGVVTVDFDARLLTLLLLSRGDALQDLPEVATAATIFGSYFRGVISLKEKRAFNILDADQAEIEASAFVINPLFYQH